MKKIRTLITLCLIFANNCYAKEYYHVKKLWDFIVFDDEVAYKSKDVLYIEKDNDDVIVCIRKHNFSCSLVVKGIGANKSMDEIYSLIFQSRSILSREKR